MTAPLLEVQGLKMHFPVKSGFFSRTKARNFAVDGVNLTINSGETLGLVGESGCGKSTLGRCISRLYQPTAGEILFKETNLARMSHRQLLPYRQNIQMIFQDPYAALSPRMTVRDIIAEPLEVLGLTKTREETDMRVREIAGKCRINLEHLRRYPHAFSGGQRQRISIARALATGPKFVVADECVAALDVSIQADILNLLKQLQHNLDLTFLFISHDLSVVAHVCDYVAVMYLGEIVEEGPTKQIFANPQHSYTQALLGAIPSLDPDQRSRVIRSDRNTSK